MNYSVRVGLSVIILVLGLALPGQILAQSCASPINTIMNFNNGQDGNMFNVTAINDIYIDSVWCNFDPGTIQEVEIWWRSGTVVGNANSANGWTMIDSVLNLTSAGTNNFTKVPIHINLFVPQGTTVGLYVTRAFVGSAGPYMRYTNGPGGSTAGQNYTSNTDLTISYAYGKDYPFGTTFNPRIWNGRLFYHCCPQAPQPEGPITGPDTVCQGDTVTYRIPWDSLAVAYEWNVPAGDSIISGQGDSLITVAIGPNSVGGEICVALEDTCSLSDDTCITYVIAQPPAPLTISGPSALCQNDSAWYSVPAVAGIEEYDWTLSNAVFLSGTDSNAVHVKVSVGNARLCVRVKDSCSWSDTTCINITTNSQPSVANAGPDRTICTGHIANLAANSPSTGNGYWTVISSPGPGTFSDSTSATSTYNTSAAGVHTLQWTVEAGGCPASSDQMTVSVNITPTANFSTQNVCDGAPVAFNDQSEGNGATINSWLWDMDGDLVNNHIVQNPIHQYSGYGTYNVRLIVNAQGCADTLFKDVFVNPYPDVDVSGEDVCLEQLVQFENNNTIPTGSIDHSVWDFGDGSAPDTSNGPGYAPVHLYQSPGIYTVYVTAVSDSGCAYTGQTEVQIYHLPVAKFTLENKCQFQETSLYDQSTVTGADVVAWLWDFGDGTDSSTVQNPVHPYEVNGFVPVRLQVWSSFGCYDDTLVQTEIYPTPVTEFNFTNKVCLGDTLHLESVSSIDYGNIPDHDWVIDTTIQKTGKDVWHLFSDTGLYHVLLTTTSNNGCSSSIEKFVPVYEVPYADFFFEDGCEDVAIQFHDTTKFEEPVMRYEWDFGDGTDLSDEHNPWHVFSDFGTYDVSLYVESFRGCSSLVSYPVAIYERLLPAFSVSPDSGCSPLFVSFIDSTESKTGVEWERTWSYGDGVERFDTAQHVYRNFTGKFKEYSVTLSVLTEQGCLSSHTLDSVVYIVPQPKGDFETIPEDLMELTTKNPTVQFVNTTRQGNKYNWTFGDGNSSRDINPFHEWATAGDYEVTMIARNIYECTDTVTRSVKVEHVNVPFIPSAFTPNDDPHNERFTISGLENLLEMRMEIYDRWGSLIYSEVGLEASWDGRDSQRNIVQSGVYIYKIIYTDEKGASHEVIGNLTVLGVN